MRLDTRQDAANSSWGTSHQKAKKGEKEKAKRQPFVTTHARTFLRMSLAGVTQATPRRRLWSRARALAASLTTLASIRQGGHLMPSWLPFSFGSHFLQRNHAISTLLRGFWTKIPESCFKNLYGLLRLLNFFSSWCEAFSATVCLFARTTHSIAWSSLLHSLRSFIRSLAHSFTPKLMGEMEMIRWLKTTWFCPTA